jgi:hypothetical protein
MITPDTPELNGWKAPKRIWLMDLGCGDVTWCEDQDPDGEQVETVEYVRADLAMSSVSQPTDTGERYPVAKAIADRISQPTDNAVERVPIQSIAEQFYLRYGEFDGAPWESIVQSIVEAVCAALATPPHRGLGAPHTEDAVERRAREMFDEVEVRRCASPHMAPARWEDHREEYMRKAAAIQASPDGGLRKALEDTFLARLQLSDHQEQLDADGVMVGVSRQALDEVLGALAKLDEPLSNPVNPGDGK